MTAQPHDFRQPPPLPAPLRAALAAWATQACAQGCKRWATQLPVAVEMESRGVHVLTASRALEALPETALRFRVALENSPDLSLLAVSHPLMAALLRGLLGEPLTAEGLEAELTPVEEGLVGFVAEQSFLFPLQQAWQLTPKLRLEAPAREPPASEPAYPPAALLLVAHFRARLPVGEHDWWWMVPRGWLSGQGEAPAPPVPTRAEREAAVRDLRLRLTVRLGEARLSLLHLATLKVGDLLVLDQPITQPLPAELGGQVKFLVWPGARGTRQAVSIRTSIES